MTKIYKNEMQIRIQNQEQKKLKCYANDITPIIFSSFYILYLNKYKVKNKLIAR